MKSISLLGSGWLGLALNSHFQQQLFKVKASTRTLDRFSLLKGAGAAAFMVDLECQSEDIQEFLDCDVLIVNITSKVILSYAQLIANIEASAIRRVLFVSSTSVYQSTNGLIKESDGLENVNTPLYQIEQLFMNSPHFQTTVVRMAGLIGPARHPGQFFKNNKQIEQPDIPVNLIHQLDCVKIISQIVEQDVWGEVFNACASTHPTKRSFYSRAKKCLSLPPPNFATSAVAEYKIVCNQKVKRVLNYKFVYDDLDWLMAPSEQSAFEV